MKLVLHVHVNMHLYNIHLLDVCVMLMGVHDVLGKTLVLPSQLHPPGLPDARRMVFMIESS